MSHSGTRVSAYPRTADLRNRCIYFALNEIASWRSGGPLVALRWVDPCGTRSAPDGESVQPRTV